MLLSGAPDGALGEFVESIWLFRGAGRSGRVELVLPTGDLDLVVDLKRHRAVVSGPSTHPFVLDAETAEREVVSVVFRIGGAAAVLGVAPGELRNHRVPLVDLWGSAGWDLVEQTATATSRREMFRAVERVLTGRLSSPRQLHPAVGIAAEQLIRRPARWRIADLSEAVGLTTRRLEQVFGSEVGLTPKTYQRLHRFRQALSGIDRASEIGLAAYAVETGYYDQAHFCAEFQAHAGLTPGEYRRLRGGELNHVPIAP